MKRILTTLIGLLTVGATLPSFAGPDWAVIEQGRKVKLERLQRAAAATADATRTTATSKTPVAPPQSTATVGITAQD